MAIDINVSGRPDRGQLIRWIGWFGIVNALLFAVVGLRYLFAFGLPGSGVALIYVALAYIAQFALLGFLPLMLLLAPVALLMPRKGLIVGLGVVLAAAGLSILVLDTNIFTEYRYHLSRLTIEIFETSTWVFTGIVFVVLLGFQAMLAGNVWAKVVSQPRLGGPMLGTLLALTWIGGQGIHIWADATAYAPVTSFTRFMPLYFPMKAKRRLAALGWIDPAEVEKQRLLRRASMPDQGLLKYPLSPLACARDQAQLPNVLMIIVDGLRPDKVGPDYTPRIQRFGEQGQQFLNHYSGGNSSRMGIFSLFYGIPSTYWQAFYDTQRPPVLVEQMLARDYEIHAFSSVGYGSPAQLDRTVFAAVGPEARYEPPEGAKKTEKNALVLKEWQKWFAERGESAQPYFNLIYFDPGNVAVDVSDAVRAQGDLAKRKESYLQGIKAIDRDVAAMLADVDEGQSGRETLVIITSDHGYEFDELGLGNIGHGSNFGPYQLRSVLMIDWPGREPQTFEHRSAHQDVPATLLTDVFGCTNPPSDYSSGNSLFAQDSWDWIMAGSYNSHAIVQPDKTIVTYPGGLIELLDAEYRVAPGAELDAQLMQDAMLEMRRFYK